MYGKLYHNQNRGGGIELNTRVEIPRTSILAQSRNLHPLVGAPGCLLSSFLVLSCEGTAVPRAAHPHAARQGSTKAGVGDFGFCFVFGKGQKKNYQILITAFPEG